jgi:hypothetical protein
MAQDLGEAKGKIIIDVAQAEAAGIRIKRVGKQMEMDLGRVSIAAKKTSLSLGALGKTLGAVGGMFGIQMGVGFVQQMGRAVVEASKLATAYKRQEVAAISLAGSTGKLNILLDAYHDVTKGTVDQATALADVTRLQAVGFADSAAELTQFLNVAQGISIAMGKDTDYVIGQLQLAIANQSFMRLDQIGLGVGEVKNRIKELKAETKGLSTEMAFQQAILGIAEEKYGKLNTSIEAQATGIESLTKALADLKLIWGQIAEVEFNESFQDLANVVKIISDFVGSDTAQQVMELAPDTGGMGRTMSGGVGGPSAMIFNRLLDPVINRLEESENKYLQSLGDLLDKGPRKFATDKLAETGYGIDDWVADFRHYILREQPALGGGSFTGGGNTMFNTDVRPSGVGGGLSAEQLATQRTLVSAHYRAVQDIERNASSNRLAATAQFERQRTETIRQFGQTMAREAEDFGIQRARANADFARNLSRMERDAIRREADMREDIESAIGDMRENHQERIAEITSDYHRDMERSEADHKEKLLGAAARLDASGVVAEQRRFAKEKKQKKTNFDKAIRDENKALEEGIANRKEALEEQLEMAKRNDERRLEDMKEDFERRKEEEDQDRQLRLERMQQDHENALEEQQRQYEERQAQINQQEADALIAQEEKFKDQMIQAGLAHETWINEQKRWQDEALKTFQDWWDDINDTMKEREANRGSESSYVPDSVRTPDDPQHMQPFADGGPVNRTGPALVHAGEFVLNPQTTGALRGMLGNFGQRDLVSAAGGKNITVAEGAVNIQASEGMDIEALGQVVRDQLVAALQVAA